MLGWGCVVDGLSVEPAGCVAFLAVGFVAVFELPPPVAGGAHCGLPLGVCWLYSPVMVRLVFVLVLGALWCAPAAWGDSGDVQFLNTLTLNELGCAQPSFMSCSDGEQGLIDLGKDVCSLARSHDMDRDAAVATFMRAAARSAPGLPLTRSKAGVFVDASERAYCPDLMEG